MEALRFERRIRRGESAREAGTAMGAPKIVSDQIQVAASLAAISTLPAVSVPSPMILDPANPGFGKLKTVMGVSRFGDGSVMS